jgi:phosphoribosylformylglycinamidine (FGAM) synthase PurS component
MGLLLWETYEVVSENDLQGVKFRGRLRKFALSKNFNLLVENDGLNKNCVRYAILHQQQIDNSIIEDYIKNELDKDVKITCIGYLQNPVLSKMEVNNEKRYNLF